MKHALTPAFMAITAQIEKATGNMCVANVRGKMPNINMKCPMCDSECVQKKRVVIDSSGIESDGGVRLYPAMHECLDRIEAVWHEHKHLDYLLADKAWLPDTSIGHILYDLWRAIRREAK